MSGPDTVADVLADGDTGAGDDTGEPQQEDYQYGLASGLARSDEAHQYVNEQYYQYQYNKYAERGNPQRHAQREERNGDAGAADDEREESDNQRAGRHDESEYEHSGEELEEDEHHLAEYRYGFGDDGFGLGVGIAARAGFGGFADRLRRDLLAVHFEFLARRAGSRNGKPHDDVADDEDAEQVAHHRTGPAHEGNPLEDGEQYRQEHGQPYPDRIDVEILADTGADAAQLGVFGVAVETARDARLFGASSRLLFGDVLGGAHLSDDIQNQGLFDHAGAVLRREDQLGDAGFDVGDDLGSVGSLLVGLFQAFEIGFQLLISVGIHRERHARNAAFLNLFHGCSVWGLVAADTAAARLVDAGLTVAAVADRTAARCVGVQTLRAVYDSFRRARSVYRALGGDEVSGRKFRG